MYCTTHGVGFGGDSLGSGLILAKCQSSTFKLFYVVGKMLSAKLPCMWNYGPSSPVESASDSRARGPRFNTWSGYILSFLLPLI